jgi:hypothetical protein
MVSGELHLICCCTTIMVADRLTKALPSPKVKHFAAWAMPRLNGSVIGLASLCPSADAEKASSLGNGTSGIPIFKCTLNFILNVLTILKVLMLFKCEPIF